MAYPPCFVKGIGRLVAQTLALSRLLVATVSAFLTAGLSSPISHRQPNVINLNRATFHLAVIQREIIAAGPSPLFWFAGQPLPHRVQVHVIETRVKFLLVAYKAVPELMLPNRPFGSAPLVQPTCGDPLNVMDDLRNSQRMGNPDQHVPMVRHQNIAAKQEPETLPRAFQNADHQRFGHLTKQGNRLMRFLLVEAAQTASRYDPRLRRAYRRLVFRKGAPIAKVAVARKLAIRLYIMLRDRIDYEEFCRRGSHAGMLGDVALV
jgi:Transposase IS116/IS110/IS902 family